MGQQQSEVVQDLLTVRDWVRWGATRFSQAELFFGHGTDNSWDEAAQLVLWQLSVPWQRLAQVADARLTHAEKLALYDLFQRRIELRLPAPYLTGIAHFAGLEFVVTPEVLIPRSPLAEVISQEFRPWLSYEPEAVLDLCTGSGCIGIACAHVFTEAEVHLSDISAPALEVAKINVERHDLKDRIKLVQSDLFAQLPGDYDLIVSNPPYVNEREMKALPPEFRAEPRLALESGADGLDFTRRLLREAADHLRPDGLLVVEVGDGWTAVEQAYPNISFTWLEFEHGGHGVFVLTRQELLQHRAELM